MPTECSKSGKSFEELAANIEPSINGIVDVDIALEAWSKYWPCLNINKNLIEFTKTVKQNTEKRKKFVGVSNFSKITQNANGDYMKAVSSSEELNFYKALKEAAVSFQRMIEVLEVSANQVTLKNWRTNQKEGFAFLKLELIKPVELEIDSDSESYSDTGEAVLENFYIKAGFIDKSPRPIFAYIFELY